MTQLNLLYTHNILSIPLPGVMVTLSQPFWSQVNTNHEAVQDKFRQSKPGKSSSWGLANSIQHLWPVTSNGNTHKYIIYNTNKINTIYLDSRLSQMLDKTANFKHVCRGLTVQLLQNIFTAAALLIKYRMATLSPFRFKE